MRSQTKAGFLGAVVLTLLSVRPAVSETGCGRLLGVDNNWECTSGCDEDGKMDKHQYRWYFYEYCTYQVYMSYSPCGCTVGVDW